MDSTHTALTVLLAVACTAGGKAQQAEDTSSETTETGQVEEEPVWEDLSLETSEALVQEYSRTFHALDFALYYSSVFRN